MFEPYRPRKLDVAEPEQTEQQRPDGDYAHWQPHELAHGSSAQGVTSAAILQQDHGQLRQDAYDEGFQQGLADGQKQARELLAQQTQQLQSAMSALREPARWIDHQLESELLSLTLSLAQQLLRHHIHADPQRLLHIIKEAVSRLPATNTTLTVHLNPDDYAHLQNLNQDSGEGGVSLDPTWQLVEDASVSPGGSVIRSGDSLVDDTVENRLAGLVERMLQGDAKSGHAAADAVGNAESQTRGDPGDGDDA